MTTPPPVLPAQPVRAQQATGKGSRDVGLGWVGLPDGMHAGRHICPRVRRPACGCRQDQHAALSVWGCTCNTRDGDAGEYVYRRGVLGMQEFLLPHPQHTVCVTLAGHVLGRESPRGARPQARARAHTRAAAGRGRSPCTEGRRGLYTEGGEGVIVGSSWRETQAG